MVYARQKNLTFDKVVFAGLGLYVLAVSLLMVSKALYLWLYIFFSLVSLFAVYAVYRIVYKGDSRGRLLQVALVVEALLATFLLYPTPLALVADSIGIRCSNWSGVTERCVDSITFLSFDRSIFVLMTPMVLLAIFTYYKTRQL